MALVPSGKTRVMVAQNFSTLPSLSEGIGNATVADEERGPLYFEDDNLDTEGAMNEDIGEETINDDVSIDTKEEDLSPEKNRKTLTSYIFEKLQQYGYPGRRLQEFKSEFVKESVSPEGVKDIEVVIPDKKYPDEKGFTDTIENEELKSIAHEVNKAFGLNFNGADRAGGKWTIKFTSASIVNPEEEAISHDSLDQVYGKPDKSNQLGQKPVVDNKSSMRAASTIREMIKDKKDGTVQKLQKINGEQNASKNVRST